ncbi:MAG: glycosyl transferase family 28 [Actinobacteria bacterium]|nr:glycosyl transferase family 28 [Actinomycetota bacterium]
MTTLLVCSGGGHLQQMWTLRPRLPVGDVRWVTFDTPQSRSLLEGEDVVFVPYAAPRDYKVAARIAKQADEMLRGSDIERVVSTGASVAVSFMGPARARRIRCHYVESAARAEGPSLSGRMVSALPGVNLYTQYPAWAGGRWHYAGSILDGFRPGPALADAPTKPTRAVVTLGTIEGYGFRSAVEAVLRVLPGDTEVLWQTGETDVSGLGIEGRVSIPAAELSAAAREADVVIAHSGTGSALMAMAEGKCAIMLPRRIARHEHVDDHQVQIAAELDRRGVAIACEVDALDADVVARAMARTVERVPDPPVFQLLRDGSR